MNHRRLLLAGAITAATWGSLSSFAAADAVPSSGLPTNDQIPTGHRLWVSDDKQFYCVAECVEYSLPDNAVILKKETGKIIKVPLVRLSQQDILFVKSDGLTIQTSAPVDEENDFGIPAEGIKVEEPEESEFDPPVPQPLPSVLIPAKPPIKKEIIPSEQEQGDFDPPKVKVNETLEPIPASQKINDCQSCCGGQKVQHRTVRSNIESQRPRRIKIFGNSNRPRLFGMRLACRR